MTEKMARVLGTIYITFTGALLLAGSLSFLAGGHLARWQVGAALVLSLGCSWTAVKAYFPATAGRIYLRLTLLAVVLAAVFAAVSGWVYDISYDGQVYHQEAVMELAQGWNPVTHILGSQESPSAVLLNHYAKGPWIYAAALYSVTGKIEISKVFNFLLMTSAAAFAYAALRRSVGLTGKQALFGAGLLALNPVSLYQSLSFYLDGQLASLLLCLLALLCLAVFDYDRYIMGNLIWVIILTVNVKFTGVVYIVLGIGLAMGWLLASGRKQVAAVLGKSAAAGLLAGILLAGYNPYVTNTIFFGHPFYPLYGAGKQTMDIMSSNSPAEFLSMPFWEKTDISLFSYSENELGQTRPVLKIPFTVTTAELKPFLYGADVRIGGFGPWFGGVLLLAGLILGAGLVYERQSMSLAGGTCLAVLVTVLVNPEAWWARYVPQLWLIPVLIVLGAISAKHRGLRRAGRLTAVVLAVNIAMVALPYALGNYYCTQAVKDQLQTLARRSSPLAVYFGDFTSLRLRLEEYHVPYVALSRTERVTKQQGTDSLELRRAYLEQVEKNRVVRTFF